MKLALSLIFPLLLGIPAYAADPVPYLKSAPMPFYPPVARTARIEGKVSLHFVVDEQGNVSEVEASPGNELLRRAAIENVQGWKFGWPNPCTCRVKTEVDFAYGVAGNWTEGEGPYVAVKWYGRAPVTRVEVQGGSQLVQP